MLTLTWHLDRTVTRLLRFAWYVGPGFATGALFGVLLFGTSGTTRATSRMNSLVTVIDSLEQELSLRPRDLRAERDSLVAWEARQLGVPAVLALAVAQVENPRADSTAVSRRGAVGLMQVMAGMHLPLIRRECRNRHIVERRCNIRVGLIILRSYYDSLGTWEQALRAYNGALDYVSAGDRYVASVEHRRRRMTEGL